MIIYYIYKHTSPSGKSYIGQTVNLKRRELAHNNPNSSCIAFASAIAKYGWSNFTHEILACCTSLDNANCVECALIIEHNTVSPLGYNLVVRGVDCAVTSDESRIKRSISLKRWYAENPELAKKRADAMMGRVVSEETRQKMRGKIWSPEHKAKLSAAIKGKPKSKEHVAKMVAAKKGKPGRPHTPESKQRLSEAKKGKPGHKQTKETKSQISAKLVGIRQGYKWFHNPETKQMRMYNPTTIPIGWLPGTGKTTTN